MQRLEALCFFIYIYIFHDFNSQRCLKLLKYRGTNFLFGKQKENKVSGISYPQCPSIWGCGKLGDSQATPVWSILGLSQGYLHCSSPLLPPSSI